MVLPAGSVIGHHRVVEGGLDMRNPVGDILALLLLAGGFFLRLGHLLLPLAQNRAAGALARARVGARALTVYRQAPSVPKTAIAAQVHEAV